MVAKILVNGTDEMSINANEFQIKDGYLQFKGNVTLDTAKHISNKEEEIWIQSSTAKVIIWKNKPSEIEKDKT